MIRRAHKDDMDALMDIWLRTNIEAHSFVPKEYWLENYDSVREALPGSNLFLYEDDGIIKGFVGMREDYIAGIFVGREYQGQGIGSALLDHCKSDHSSLALDVYMKNLNSVNFYKKQGFEIIGEKKSAATGQIEYYMSWTRKEKLLS